MIRQETVVVTGATGHVGNVLVRELLERGRPVRALVLPGEDTRPIDGLEIETAAGDVRDRDGLLRAFGGASTVYHLAGLVSILPGQRRALHEVNVLGTRNVLHACKQCGIGRMVYVSSVHALEEPPRGVPVTENAGNDPLRIIGDYAQSKALATREVMSAAKEGLDAVVVYPSGVVGPYDFKVSEMGRLILDFARGRLPGYVEGAYDFVDVRDVVNGLIAAGEQGRAGEGYILSGEILSVSRLMTILQNLTGIAAPSFCFPPWLANSAAIFTPLLAAVTGTKARFTRYSLCVLRSNAQMDCTKARLELGYQARTLEVSFTDAIEWFRRSGLWDTVSSG